MAATKKTAKAAMNGSHQTVNRISEATTGQELLLVPPLKLHEFAIKIVGITPLICNAWSDKAIQMIVDKQMKLSSGKSKEAKNPDQCARDARYMIEDHKDLDHGVHGFPVRAFKAAAVSAAADLDGMTKTGTRRAFFLRPNHEYEDQELAALEFERCNARRDMVRVGMGTADVRFRPEYHGWTTSMIVQHDPTLLSAQQIICLLDRGGFSVGVGEWRPEKVGMNGRFRVEAQ